MNSKGPSIIVHILTLGVGKQMYAFVHGSFFKTSLETEILFRFYIVKLNIFSSLMLNLF